MDTRIIVRKALENGLVIPAFNIPHPPMLKPIAQAIVDENSVAMIQVARLEWEKFESGSLENIANEYAKYAVEGHTLLHLDHVPVIDEDHKEVDYMALIRRAIVAENAHIGAGAVVDNVDQGGMAAPIDIDTGVIRTVGANKNGDRFEFHPITGTRIPGTQIPYWEEVKAMCLKAMHVVPQVRFVAWDVAITPDGPVFIEGNSFPSHAIPQFAAHFPDGVGILPRFEAFIDL